LDADYPEYGVLIPCRITVTETDERLRRLYRSIEDGIVELDDILRERTATLKSDCERPRMIAPALSAVQSRRLIPRKSMPSFD
jgi:hypothetical protein